MPELVITNLELEAHEVNLSNEVIRKILHENGAPIIKADHFPDPLYFLSPTHRWEIKELFDGVVVKWEDSLDVIEESRVDTQTWSSEDKTDFQNIPIGIIKDSVLTAEQVKRVMSGVGLSMVSPTPCTSTTSAAMPSQSNSVPCDLSHLFGPALKWVLVRSVLFLNGHIDKFPDPKKILADPEISASYLLGLIKDFYIEISYNGVDECWVSVISNKSLSSEKELEESVAKCVIMHACGSQSIDIPEELYPDD